MAEPRSRPARVCELQVAEPGGLVVSATSRITHPSLAETAQLSYSPARRRRRLGHSSKAPCRWIRQRTSRARNLRLRTEVISDALWQG